ncbi:hypothetical protein TRFO_14264 [Tritrichomonas foetus]|uniref:Mid2 domain-containing protein n=1 Tax=Tritrichomonas foetus TaxID=1144522 RepID=A0A1J4L057_9EUKA|nr:hypothetical protein TRFO_14264 [Tritrichomonas foetus]|eukprot:OHT15237.1 hypothetical protein TRFO_14264 [Tritrichomonas foetus]
MESSREKETTSEDKEQIPISQKEETIQYSSSSIDEDTDKLTLSMLEEPTTPRNEFNSDLETDERTRTEINSSIDAGDEEDNKSQTGMIVGVVIGVIVIIICIILVILFILKRKSNKEYSVDSGISVEMEDGALQLFETNNSNQPDSIIMTNTNFDNPFLDISDDQIATLIDNDDNIQNNSVYSEDSSDSYSSETDTTTTDQTETTTKDN